MARCCSTRLAPLLLLVCFLYLFCLVASDKIGAFSRKGMLNPADTTATAPRTTPYIAVPGQRPLRRVLTVTPKPKTDSNGHPKLPAHPPKPGGTKFVAPVHTNAKLVGPVKSSAESASTLNTTSHKSAGGPKLKSSTVYGYTAVADIYVSNQCYYANPIYVWLGWSPAPWSSWWQFLGWWSVPYGQTYYITSTWYNYVFAYAQDLYGYYYWYGGYAENVYGYNIPYELLNVYDVCATINCAYTWTVYC